MGAVAPREGDMRMPWAQIRKESDREGCVLNPLVKLKKMRVAFSNANPNDFRRAFRWKCPNALDRKKKCAELDGTQFFAERNINVLRGVGKETEREMHLITRCPTHAANPRVEIDQ